MKKILSYPRSVIFGIAAVLFVGAYGLWLIFLSIILDPERARRAQDYIFKSWAAGLLKMFTVEVQIFGRENLVDRGVLFLFNHTSHYDIPVFYHSVHRPWVRFGAKIELFKIPIMAQIMKRTGTLPIARQAREQVMQLYRDSIERVAKGESFVLAAEGTRQPRPGVGESFKSGPLIFAISGQFEIQPVVIWGAYEILPKTRLFPSWGKWHNLVRVSILPVISTRGLGLEDRDRLKSEIRARMTAEYQRLAQL